MGTRAWIPRHTLNRIGPRGAHPGWAAPSPAFHTWRAARVC
jgi:hypothetical protein